MFVIVFLEKRNSFLNNLILALGIKRVTRDSPTFFYGNSKTRNNKNYGINYNFFASPEKLKRYCKQEWQHWYSYSTLWYSSYKKIIDGSLS